MASKKKKTKKGRPPKLDFNPPEFAPAPPVDKDELVIEGLRQNNLKDLTLSIPHNRMTAVVGPSGSGKSSLAFDTLFAEGRWRFIESLSTYTRMFIERMDRPDLDSIRNIRPAVALEQKNPVRGSRSTVGTTTELNDYLRVLFSRAGSLHCPKCGEPVSPTDPDGLADRVLEEKPGARLLVGFSKDTTGKSAAELTEELLSAGFIRVKAKDRTVDISTEPLKGRLPKRLRVVADRVVAKAEARQRLVEALESAFREGGGEAWLEADGQEEDVSLRPVCSKCGEEVKRPTPVALSFNHPVGACPECKGFGNVLKYDEDKIVPDKDKTLAGGAIEPWTKPAYSWWYDELEAYAPDYGIDLEKPFRELTKKERELIFGGTGDFEGINEFFDHLETKKYKLHIKVFTSRYKGQVTCRACKGTRLKKEALSVTLGGMNIAEVSRLTIKDAAEFFSTLELAPLERELSREVIRQITTKLEFLNQTGLGYITLDRLTKTLSGGEAQRVQLATQLASTLTGVLYILDEPSIGLHPVDIDMLIEQIRKLSARGNTVVVVEHDPTVVRSSEHIVELGPGAGESGGRLVWTGPTDEFLKEARTLTSDYLTGEKTIHVPTWRRKGSGEHLTLEGASGNNLKNIDVSIPLRTLTCVTGVSGSGKSTLVVDTLYNILARHFGEKFEKPKGFKAISGTAHITGVKLVDQSPIGRTPRSNPLTYIGGFDDIRHAFADTPAARAAGLSPGDFSFNVPGGRCEKCKGEGVEKLEMYFLPDVYIKCAVCGGRRYKSHVLEVTYRGYNIYQCLELTFSQAWRLFPDSPRLQKKFSVMMDVGLGYLKLGQAATTLSGGEAQRLKIARELVDEKGEGDAFYILDEPTTGLHMDDTRKLMNVLGSLVDAGNTVLVIEHNLDCVKKADHIIDLGPGGGESGGRVVAEGAPEELAEAPDSVTGRYLKGILE